MYLVSPDYVNKHERPVKKLPPPTPSKRTVHKTRVKREIKQPPHPYDKWIAVRGKITEASVERKALIKAIGNFIKEVLPNATLVNTNKRESDTQTVPDYTTQPPLYETPNSTRKEGPLWLPLRYLPLVLDLKLPLIMMWVVVLVKKIYVHLLEFLSSVASSYLSSFVNRRRVLDTIYGLRKEGDKFL
jgi:hypothetical protein